MKIGILIILSFFTIACHNDHHISTTTPAARDSTPFGQIQPFLSLDSTERVLRIDSLLVSGPGDQKDATVYYITDKGPKRSRIDRMFKKIFVAGFRPDGSNSCVASTGSQEGTLYYCFDSACTITVDSANLHFRTTPYPVSHPKATGKSDSCKGINDFNGAWRRTKNHYG